MNARKLIATTLMLGAGGIAWAQEPEQPERERERRPPRPPMEEPRHREPRPGFEGREPGPGLHPEQIERILRAIREIEPRKAEELERLRERDPDRFLHMIRETGEHVRRIHELRERNPEEFERFMRVRRMEEETERLAGEIRRTDSADEREKMTAKLREQLNELFDLREAGREREVKELEKRLVELRKILKERRERKAEIVKRRMEQMMGKGEVLDW